MKENESKIAFICFHLLFQIEPFQGLAAEKNNKISDPLPGRSVHARGCKTQFSYPSRPFGPPKKRRRPTIPNR
jgi:hypothetical protein